MWKELLAVFRGVEPLQDVADRFMGMLAVCLQMAEEVRPHVHGPRLDRDKWNELLALDRKVNDGAWAIRRALVNHVAIQNSELPFCLKLMSLVKDTERLGEYVKNVAYITRSVEGAVADGPVHAEIEELVRAAMSLFSEAGQIIAKGDKARANEAITTGKAALLRSDALTKMVARSSLTAAQAYSTALVTFFYARIVSHLINLVSSVVLPPHDLDRYDERFESA